MCVLPICLVVHLWFWLVSGIVCGIFGFRVGVMVWVKLFDVLFVGFVPMLVWLICLVGWCLMVLDCVVKFGCTWLLVGC